MLGVVGRNLERLPAESVLTTLGPGADPAAPVADEPAPWLIQGRGHVALLRQPASVLDGDRFISPALAGRRRAGRLAILMYVDYGATPAGPYRELLYIPGAYDFAGRHFWSISRIFVSTMDSVVNGRRNWGIPKDLAQFDVQDDEDRETVTITTDGQPLARLGFRRARFVFPVTTALVPKKWRGLGQVLGDHLFLLTPEAKGRAGFGRVTELSGNAALFPALDQARVLATLDIARFQMTFPVASITPL